MHHGSAMSMSRSPDRVIMNRMIVCRDRLESGRVSIGKGTTRRSKDVANLQIVEAPRWYKQAVLRVEVRLGFR